MHQKLTLCLCLSLLLVSCGGIIVPVLPAPGRMPPSPSPAIRSPTLPYVPSITSTRTVTPVWTDTPTPTSTFPLTPSYGDTAALLVEISGCNTSLDISHGMGEVTNAYPLIINKTAVVLHNACATLSASDEGRVHPDKTICVDTLPVAHQVILKLTVDTGFQEDTSVQIDIATLEGMTAQALAPSCLDIGIPGWIPAKVGVIEPLP